MVGTMQNLVNEVLQSAVGNHFRNTLQRLEAVRFIETRDEVQEAALEAITRYLSRYDVETRGVYIQDVMFPEELVKVLTEREIAKQEKATFHEQREAQHARIEVEKARGTADMQGQLATSQVSIEINANAAEARAAQARGEAAYVETTARAEATKVEVIGRADASRIEAIGLAEASKVQAVGAAEAIAHRGRRPGRGQGRRGAGTGPRRGLRSAEAGARARGHGDRGGDQRHRRGRRRRGARGAGDRWWRQHRGPGRGPHPALRTVGRPDRHDPARSSGCLTSFSSRRRAVPAPPGAAGRTGASRRTGRVSVRPARPAW